MPLVVILYTDTVRIVMCHVSEAIYPPEFSVKHDSMKSTWFKYMLVDEACKLVATCQDDAMHCPHAPISHPPFTALSTPYCTPPHSFSMGVSSTHLDSWLTLSNPRLSLLRCTLRSLCRFHHWQGKLLE